MFKILFIREIQGYLYSLKFQISFVIVLLVFITGSFSFVSSFGETQTNYSKLRQIQTEELRKRAENISRVATYWDHYVTAPRSNSLLADCKENLLPNSYEYSGYNVFGFSVRHDSVNPLLKRTESLSWAFIISMFLSFITLLFAFDAVSGEKEDHTLSLVFSNPVSRKTFLAGKLAGIIAVVGSMAVIGIMISLLIVAVSGKVMVDSTLLKEIAGFILISLLFISIFAAFGLFSSTVTAHSNVSLLISLCFWLFAAVVIPNTSVFWANKLFPIPNAEEVETAIREEREDINKNAPEGSWSSNGSDPFYSRHELRANNQTNLMMAEKRHKDHYYSQMFRQFEKTRMFTVISPIAQFDYMNEAFLGGGYLRFQQNWKGLHAFQEQFLQWFKDIDAQDEKSPHWYNPYEDYSTSKKPVDPESIPRYKEQAASFGERFQFIGNYAVVMFLTVGIFFLICFWRFTSYDVR
jgi:ABC-type transport system involved in multi-copper enzyme maturation, permease component